jgi:hypothetical protein
VLPCLGECMSSGRHCDGFPTVTMTRTSVVSFGAAGDMGAATLAPAQAAHGVLCGPAPKRSSTFTWVPVVRTRWQKLG